MEKLGSRKRRGARRSRAERAEVLSAYRGSGLTQAQFARQAGINLGTLRGWIYKQPAVGREAPGGFAPVRIVGGPRPTEPTRGAVTVRWPQGLEVEIAVELDPAGVERLVQTLLAPCLR